MEQLPEELYCPAVRLDEGGVLDAQTTDDDGNIIVLAWGDQTKAWSWLQAGGLKLWTRPAGEVVLAKRSRQDMLDMYSHSYGIDRKVRRYLDFEPDAGSLFSPAERRILLVDGI
jgi:hypothetical protein